MIEQTTVSWKVRVREIYNRQIKLNTPWHGVFEDKALIIFSFG